MNPEGSPPGSPAPDALSSEAVARKSFASARKGYDRAEVRGFLQEAAAALAAATARIADLERRLAREVVASDVGGTADLDDGLLEAISAEAWRNEVLSDLDRRRRELNAEVMRLRAGRDHLREDIAGVADALTEQMRKLDDSVRAARTAGDLEGQRIRSEAGLSPEEQGAELQAARLAGFVTVEARAPESPEQAEQAPPVAEVEVVGDDSAPTAPARELDDLFARLRAERTDGER